MESADSVIEIKGDDGDTTRGFMIPAEPGDGIEYTVSFQLNFPNKQKCVFEI